MKGIKVILSSTGCTINPDASVSGFDATIQNALVNIATRAGTDHAFSDKGTALLSNAVAGKIAGLNDANHESQLAALQTLFFSRAQDTAEANDIRIGKIDMSPATFDGKILRVDAAFTNLSNTRIIGTTTTL